jgi:uncharacterized protein
MCSDVFSWTVQPGGPETGGYSVAELSGRGVAGQLVTEAVDVMDVGRMAVAVDPAGAVFGIWQARAFPGAQIVNEPGAMCWNEQMSSDFEGSKAFYRAVFGYEYGDMSRDGLSYATFKVDGRDVGGIGGFHAGVPTGSPAGWRVYFGAADTDASVARVQGNGGSVIFEPTDHPYGRMSTVADDQGAVFSLLGVTPG